MSFEHMVIGWQQGVRDSLALVRRRLAHYESYRCNCGLRAGRPDDNIWHAVGCKAEMMETRPATFAALEEVVVLLEAMLEKGITDSSIVAAHIEAQAQRKGRVHE